MNLFHGDCLEEMRRFSDGSVDLTVTSPPYDNLRTYNGNIKQWNEEKWKNIIVELFRVTKQGGVVVWIVGDATIKGSETGTSFKQALFAMECGFLQDTMIWNKGNFTAVGALKTSYAPVFDYMFVWKKGEAKTFNPIRDRKNKRYGDVYHQSLRQKDGTMKDGYGRGVKRIAEFGQRHNVWNIHPEKSNSKRCHPAQFPEQIAHDIVISWSNAGDMVLDPFMGSGTVGVACKKLNRYFIGIEIDQNYFSIAEKRINGG